MHIEWAPFRVKDNIDDQTVIRAAEEIQTGFLAKQKGFVKRELLRGEGNQWVDIIHWESKGDADTAGKLVMESPVCLAYFEMMADATEKPAHFAQVKAW